jgi:nucleotide-binding universal stress UspA family protein
MTSSIICGVDHSPNARAAARVAAELAERLGLRLHLVHATPADAPPPLSTAPPAAVPDREGIRRAAEREITGLLADLLEDTGPVDATGRIEQGPAAERLAAVAEEERGAFIVVGTRGEAAAKAALVGSVSIATVKAAPCPVIVVPPAVVREQPEPLAGEVIVCGIRGPEDRSVVHGAARLAAHLDLRLTLAQVGAPQDRDVPGATVSAVPLAGAPTRDRASAEARTMLTPLVLAARKIAPRVDEPVLLAGDPAHQLATMADELPAALLVVGTRRRGPIRSGLLGSVSRSLACSATVPVVVDPLRYDAPA